MPVTVTWSVKPNGLLTTTKSGNSDFIVRVEYDITGTDGINTITMPYTETFDVVGQSFTPFTSLSESQVVSWAQEKLGAAQLANLQLGFEKQLELMSNPPPPVVERTVPWST